MQSMFGQDINSIMGYPGGASSFNASLNTTGGKGGLGSNNGGWYWLVYSPPVGGAGGTASGGDVNLSGAAGDIQKGGAAGGPGGIGGTTASQNGGVPGGGGGGGPDTNFGGGGGGGYSKKTYPAGAFSTGSSVQLAVGTGGASRDPSSTGSGAAGAVKFTWTATGQTLSLCSPGYELKNGKCVSTAVCATCPPGHTMKVTPGARVAPTVTTTGGGGTTGTQTYAVPGNHSFTIPNYTGTLTVEVWGGGGGGSGGHWMQSMFGQDLNNIRGYPGETSTFNAVYSQPSCTSQRGCNNTPTLISGLQATGGTGGLGSNNGGWYWLVYSPPVGGAGGTASGGDVNLSGAAGDIQKGGAAGGPGGIGGTTASPNGGVPGGGGGGGPDTNFGGGGGGGYSKKTYPAGAFGTGSSVQLVVGTGGASRDPSNTGAGGVGMVKITWTAANAVTSTTCPTGYTLQGSECVAPDTTQCIPDTTCPPGYHRDLLTNQCVINAPTVCIPGYHLDTATNRCVPDAGPTVVIIGTPSTPGIPSNTATWNTTAVIKWSSTNTSSCVGSATAADGTPVAFDTGGATSGEITTGPITQTTTFTITCETPSGPQSESTTIQVTSCPAGYTGTPPVCTLASDQCPLGYTGTPPNCSVAASCPLGYSGTPPNCVADPACPAGETWNGTQCVCSPSNICSGLNVVNSCTGAIVRTCVYQCSAGACVIPAPVVVEWKVSPLVVPAGNSSTATWEVKNVSSCSVTTTGGDSWTGLTGTKVSRPIFNQTVFTLTCQPLPGSGAEPVTRTATVNIVPVFQEV